MERFHDIFGPPHELIVHAGWGRVLQHKVANGLYSIVETKREHCWGAPNEVFWREQLPSGKLRHDIGKRESEVA